jgi:prepilin signal peptidase PulO-like enzyme (type II secretory pathway)
MEMLRAIAIGVIAGAIYVWPFAASKSYKQLVLNDVRQGRPVALLNKIISILVGGVVAIASIVAVRVLSSNALALMDFGLFLGAAAASGWLAWRYLYNAKRT